MKVSVRVKANSKKESVEKKSGEYVVCVKEPAKEGKANEAVVEKIAEYFGVPKSRVRIISGHTFHKKVIEVS